MADPPGFVVAVVGMMSLIPRLHGHTDYLHAGFYRVQRLSLDIAQQCDWTGDNGRIEPLRPHDDEDPKYPTSTARRYPGYTYARCSSSSIFVSLFTMPTTATAALTIPGGTSRRTLPVLSTAAPPFTAARHLIALFA